MHDDLLQGTALPQWPVVFGVTRGAEGKAFQATQVRQVCCHRVQVHVCSCVVQLDVGELQGLVNLGSETGVERPQILE